MHSPSAEDQWQWHEGLSSLANVCVYALVRDGMRVPPFTQHPDGDNSLRRSGLTPMLWRRWLEAVLKEMRRHELGQDAQMAPSRARPPQTPGSLCAGPIELGRAIDEMWLESLPAWNRWKAELTTGRLGIRERLAPGHYERLREALRPFHDIVPHLSIVLVEYPAPAIMPVPPTDVIVALPVDAPADSYAAGVLESARRLASFNRSGAAEGQDRPFD